MTPRTLTLASLVVLAAAAGTASAVWWMGRGDDPFAPCREGAVAGAAAIGGPFDLVSETGETVTAEAVLDEPSLVYFGYTYCPDVCPFDASRNAEAVDLLAERGYDVQPVFISVDTERDTPEVMAEFTDYMHPDMLGLTGSPEQVKAAAQAYRVYYAKRGEDPATYLMDHTVFTYLMVPGHGFIDLFRGAPGASGEGVTAAEVADRTACYLSNT
ncbi:protein SCO1/2 [Palleronia marisminoris]|uniref:SCO1/SenC n=1 Tax=Palleronia marisminoris TaxID=315423 RepID=A0A1Y5T3R6_9RHOB|nr:SCO family protein [Palleronia marisminoris]SFH07100.1 protein SCO1/2 [Palleronia marisminoris]SLN51680.1 SCO1/SenC [Palleronia marisminoris]